MENLTNVTEEVVTNVTEEVVTKIGASTVVTGVCAATGAVAIVYVIIKGAKWAYGKAKTAAAARKEAIDQDDDTDFDAEVDEN